MNRWIAMLLGCLTIGALTACRGNPEARYKPAPTTAREAIDTALSAWKSGAPYAPIKDGKPEINVFDARWQSGKKLESYKILEEVPDQEYPRFKVRIKLAGKSTEVNEYLVVGIDPLLVFRDSDYKRTSGM